MTKRPSARDNYFFRYCPRCLVHNYFRPNPGKKGIVCEDCGFEISVSDLSFLGLKPAELHGQKLGRAAQPVQA